jgi:ketosteroid isomerase-like protein
MTSEFSMSKLVTAKYARLGALLCILSSAKACTPATNPDNGLAELEQAVAAFYRAVDSGDKDAHAEMFTSGALMMPNNGAIIRGKEDIGAVVRGGAGWVFRIRNLVRAELDLSGDIAYTVNEYEYTWHAEGEEPTWNPTKNIHIWRRQPDGSWKLHVDIWNSSE